ncbi:hypothetical protein Pelo_14762 [Pelomyxa schiedti]|nr:hypothetical protein Pelo_14762 [Pelomyxa schiedti]
MIFVFIGKDDGAPVKFGADEAAADAMATTAETETPPTATARTNGKGSYVRMEADQPLTGGTLQFVTSKMWFPLTCPLLPLPRFDDDDDQPPHPLWHSHNVPSSFEFTAQAIDTSLGPKWLNGLCMALGC